MADIGLSQIKKSRDEETARRYRNREAVLAVVGGICPQKATDAMVSAAENCFASASRDEIRRAWCAMFDEATRNG